MVTKGWPKARWLSYWGNGGKVLGGSLLDWNLRKGNPKSSKVDIVDPTLVDIVVLDIPLLRNLSYK